MTSFFDDNRMMARIVQGVLGLVGVYAIARWVPRLFKSATKRFFVGLIGEILIVAAAMLLTERRSSEPHREHASTSTDGGS
jgi:hypothetical protein